MKSLLEHSHQLRDEWAYDLNEGIDPREISYGSERKFWWRCPQDHVWRASANTRTSRPRGCPYCAGNLPVSGVNDFLTIFPEEAGEWHPGENQGSPANFLPASMTVVVWLCSTCARSWSSRILDRTLYHRKCPYCVPRGLIAGRNDLASLAPAVAAQWDSDLNELSPPEVHAGSNKVYSWVCSEGHRWKATPADVCRVWRYQFAGRPDAKKIGCPECAKERIGGAGPRGLLCQEYPHLGKEWDKKANGIAFHDLKTTSGSDRKFWWRCSQDHTWQASPKGRGRYGRGCPYCSNRRVWPGFNDLGTVIPQALKFWDKENNEGLDPSQIAPTSRVKVSWMCPQGHKFVKSPTQAMRSGIEGLRLSCPQCRSVS